MIFTQSENEMLTDQVELLRRVANQYKNELMEAKQEILHLQKMLAEKEMEVVMLRQSKEKMTVQNFEQRVDHKKETTQKHLLVTQHKMGPKAIQSRGPKVV